jgi:hypothetical protein
VTRNPDSDVDRAVAALGASPMPYRSFSDAAPASPTSDGSVGGNKEFSLLVSALPQVAMFQTSHTLPDRMAAPGNHKVSAADALAPIEAEAAETAAQAAVVQTQQPNAMSLKEQAARNPVASPASQASDTPFRYAAPSGKMPSQRSSVQLPSIDSHATSLRAVFRALQAAEPSRKPLFEKKTGLKNLFNLL